MLSIIATIIILIFLFIRNIYKNKNSNSGNFISDSNILNVSILKNEKKNIDEIINQLKPHFIYLKLKSANIEKSSSNYIFWYESDSQNWIVIGAGDQLDGRSEIEGSIRFYKSRFLHFEANLSFS